MKQSWNRSVCTPRARRVGAGVIAGALLAGGAVWRATPGASQVVVTPPVQEDSAVRTLPVDALANAGRRGSTYYWLESQSSRVTSRYDDGTVVVGERGADGALHAKITDGSGNELGWLDVADTLRYTAAAGESLQAIVRADIRPTLEWTNRQAYSLLKDGIENLSWKDGLIRSGNRDPRPRVLETEWIGGLTVRTERRANARDAGPAGRVFTGEALSAHLTRDGAELGASDWYAQSGVFRWSIPSLRLFGSVEPKHLERYGGWPFAPDAEWLNLQVLAFYRFKSLIDAKGFVASNVKGCGQQPSMAARLANALVPRLQANEEGCDNLHWLDGSIYRFCCDIHDRCYEKSGCTSSSWWQFWSSWRCTTCNTWAIWCFATGGCLSVGGLSCA